jgi:hypothetical protein
MVESFYIGLSRLSTPHDRQQAALSAEGRRILRLLDGDHPVIIEPGGRPCFQDKHADFSISHSRDMAAVAWRSNLTPASGGPPRIGCDIQYAESRKPRAEISRRFFAPSEQEYIASAGETGIRRFYQIWVLKEAALKMRGLSVVEMAAAPEFGVGVTRPDGTGTAPLPPDCFLYELASESGELYLLAAVCEPGGSGKTPEPEFRWFSESKLSVTRIDGICCFGARPGGC